MKKLMNSLKPRRASRVIRLAASLIASMTLAGGISAASATPLKTSIGEKPAPITLNTAQTPTNQTLLANVQPENIQTTQMSMGNLSPLLL